MIFKWYPYVALNNTEPGNEEIISRKISFSPSDQADVSGC